MSAPHGGGLPTVIATRLVTSGEPHLVVTCPRCGNQHRHLGAGLRRAPCGGRYLVAQADPHEGGPPPDTPVSVRGMQAAVALVTAEAGNVDLPQARILGGTPAQEALQALAWLVSSLLVASAPDAMGRFLRSVGATTAQFERDGHE
ncbi:hypothetical protein [Streptomyces noursei]|uniref:hypothetical protein n=1 Tax=Streptomyces noursei TaxID=1971 RepID=UPI0035D574E9